MHCLLTIFSIKSSSQVMIMKVETYILFYSLLSLADINFGDF